MKSSCASWWTACRSRWKDYCWPRAPLLKPVSALLLALLLSAEPAAAQDSERHASDLEIAGVNVAIGAVTAAVWRAVTNRPVLPGAARGAVAGAAVFAGKRIIAEARPGYWWLGRQLVAIGGSEVANAAQSRQVLERATLPVGPLRLHVDRSATRKIRPALDVVTTVATVVLASRKGHSFALDESLATGAVVFMAPEDSEEIGQSIAGAMTVSELAPDAVFFGIQSKRRIMGHELVHVAQNDFTFNALSDPAQSYASAKLPLARRITRYLDFNLVLPIQSLANSMIEHGNRPWEKEANAIAHRTP